MLRLQQLYQRPCQGICIGAKRWFSRVGPPSSIPTEKKHKAPPPRRALMYLPGHDERKVQKAAGLDVDCVCLDMEDAVADNKKEVARQSIVHFLQTISFGRSDVAVRVNSVTTPHVYQDLEAILTAPVLPNTIVLPKVDTPEQLEWFFEASAHIIQNHQWDHPKDKDKFKQKLRLITQVESGLGLMNLRKVCELDNLMCSASEFYSHESVIIGGDDLAADLGGTRTVSNAELLYARQHTIAVVKAFGMQAIDIVNIRFKDLEALELEALEGAHWGFDGKQVIHPNQVPVVQDAFTPTQEKLDWAVGVLTAFKENNEQGTGAFAYEGEMIDMPTVKQCANIFKLGVVAGKLENDESLLV